MLTGFLSLFRRRRETTYEDNAQALVKLLVKLCGLMENMDRKLDNVVAAVEGTRNEGALEAARAYRDCLNRTYEFALGVQGQVELASQFRRFDTLDKKIGTRVDGGPYPDPLTPENPSPDDEWPPAGHIEIVSKG